MLNLISNIPNAANAKDYPYISHISDKIEFDAENKGIRPF